MTGELKMNARWNFQTYFKTNNKLLNYNFDLKILIADIYYQ